MYEKQKGRCWLCGKEMGEHRFDVHHLRNDHDPFSEDIVAMCKGCHTSMHKVTAIVEGNKIRFEGEVISLLEEKGFER